MCSFFLKEKLQCLLKAVSGILKYVVNTIAVALNCVYNALLCIFIVNSMINQSISLFIWCMEKNAVLCFTKMFYIEFNEKSYSYTVFRAYMYYIALLRRARTRVLWTRDHLCPLHIVLYSARWAHESFAFRALTTKALKMVLFFFSSIFFIRSINGVYHVYV